MMEMNNEVFVAIAVSVAVGLACILWTMLCCVYHLCYRMKRKDRKHVVDIEMMQRSPTATIVVLQERDEQQVAKRAFQESGNVLWTNKGKVWWAYST